MAKLSINRVLELSQLLKTEAGDQLREALEYLNALGDQVIRNLRQGLNIEDNFKALTQTVTLKDGIEQVINYDKFQIPYEVRVLRTISTQYGYQSILWYFAPNGDLTVKVGFTGGPTEPVEVVLAIFYK